MTTPFLAAMRAYWSASGAPGELPELPDSPLDAFIELLDRTSEQPGAYVLMDVSRDPYPGMALGDESEPWTLLWALSLAQLEAFQSPRDPDLTFLVDTVADPTGVHRVYTYGDDAATPLAFASIVDALGYMAAELEHARGQRDAAALEAALATHRAELTDAWEEGPSSGRFVLDGLLALPFPDAWDALSRGEWPVVDSLRRPFRGKGEPGWQRAFSLWFIERFLESRRLTLPTGVKASELDSAHRELVRQVAALEESLHTGLVPELIEQLAAGSDPVTAAAASEWVKRFDAWAAASESAPLPADEPGDDLGLDLDGDMPLDPMKLLALLGKRPDADRASPIDPGIAPIKRAGKAKSAAAVPESLLPPPLEPEQEDTPFTRKLRVAVGTCLDEMVRDEVIELVEDSRDALVDELVEAAADSRSAQHMLKQLTRTLVSSDHIEEIYASDDEVSDLFRRTMER